MKAMTARELKNATGEVVRTLRRGESILLSYRGKPLGTIVPVVEDDPRLAGIRPFEEAWSAIESELLETEPRFASWQQAEDHSRGRR